MDKISNGIPTGRTRQDIKARHAIITRFYREWRQQHPLQRVYNVHLRDYVNVRSVSARETAEKASLRHRSTLAALQFEAVLAQARKVGTVPPKPGNKRQGAFKEIIIIGAHPARHRPGKAHRGREAQRPLQAAILHHRHRREMNPALNGSGHASPHERSRKPTRAFT